MAHQLRLDGTSEPYGPQRRPGSDPALEARIGRRDANRERLAGTDAAYERSFASGWDDPHTAPMDKQYGIPNVFDSVVNSGNMPEIGPHDSPVFRKLGRDKEVPLIGPDRLTTMQDTVSPERVDEIRRNPGLGTDSRFPGRELPLSIELDVGPGGFGRPGGVRDVLWNGNHRVAAAVEDGQMFTPVRSIPNSWVTDAGEMAQQDADTFRSSREEKYRTSGARLQNRNPFATKDDLSW